MCTSTATKKLMKIGMLANVLVAGETLARLPRDKVRFGEAVEVIRRLQRKSGIRPS